MSIATMILGQSGTGKTASLRNLPRRHAADPGREEAPAVPLEGLAPVHQG
jgi:stage III sporulation protein SpoIIIAA